MSKQTLQERTGILDWNDLRTVLAVARAGSLAGAARELELRHSTVFRRIEQAERRLGARLFERARSGWAANPQGEVVARAAAEMEAAALGAERSIHGADARLEGTIRIATSEMLAGWLLPPLLATFLAEHPGIEIEADVSNRNVDLTRREADIALRATLQPPEPLVGRQAATMRYAVYAPKALVAGRRRAPVLDELPWVGFDERIAHFEIARWLRDALPAVRPRLRVDSMPALLHAAAAGVGAAALPIFAASQEPRLVRITPPIEGPAMGLWVLHHPDVRGNARVRALAAFLAQAVPAELERVVQAGPTCKVFAECPLARRRRGVSASRRS
ncbi:MAG: LysR family transcriptional regulator [Piscinibacter sp.]|nr:LysR family transcriptional regulator [Piscinibacter sp.]